MHVAAALSLPYFSVGSLDLPTHYIPFIGRDLPIQGFGAIVALGVVLGAALLRRYAEWNGLSDEHIRHLTGWVTISGFIGAHLFDVIAYQWHDAEKDPLLIIEVWKGISSYGGFIGGAAGFAFYVWWKRLPARLMADITIVGLLPAFTIGRIGCTVVSDHVGAVVDPSKWYSALAMDYPRDLKLETVQNLVAAHPGAGSTIAAWNLGLIEFLYLVPVNVLVLWLAFRAAKPKETAKSDKAGWVSRLPAGLLPVMTGVFYAPVRFFLDFLRPEESDPRYLGLTFAQWASILAFSAACYAAMRILKTGKPSEPVTRTSGEAQRALRTMLKDEADKQADEKAAKLPIAKVETKPEAKPEPKAEPKAEVPGDEEDDVPEDDIPEPPKQSKAKTTGKKKG